MAAVLHLLVRFIHIVGMAILVGGTLFTWITIRTTQLSTVLLRKYEWAFWGTLGVMVITGVGNIGARGAPGPATQWGTLLTAKLTLVLLFTLGSILRTLTVLRLSKRQPIPDRGTTLLRQSYAATAGALLLIAAVAEVLAHG
ncbi:MAG: CopD family protein [Halobacteriaceae archaeon]